MDDNMLLGKDNELSEEMNRTDYIYMVSRRNLIISLNAELDHHLADEMREVIDEIIDERRKQCYNRLFQGRFYG